MKRESKVKSLLNFHRQWGVCKSGWERLCQKWRHQKFISSSEMMDQKLSQSQVHIKQIAIWWERRTACAEPLHLQVSKSQKKATRKIHLSNFWKKMIKNRIWQHRNNPKTASSWEWTSLTLPCLLKQVILFQTTMGSGVDSGGQIDLHLTTAKSTRSDILSSGGIISSQETITFTSREMPNWIWKEIWNGMDHMTKRSSDVLSSIWTKRSKSLYYHKNVISWVTAGLKSSL